MKCIKNNADGKILRVSEASAAIAVESGRATFAKKELYKLQENPKYSLAKQESTMSNLDKRKKRIYTKKVK
jgi:hypothetical protein